MQLHKLACSSIFFCLSTSQELCTACLMTFYVFSGGEENWKSTRDFRGARIAFWVVSFKIIKMELVNSMTMEKGRK